MKLPEVWLTKIWLWLEGKGGGAVPLDKSPSDDA